MPTPKKSFVKTLRKSLTSLTKAPPVWKSLHAAVTRNQRSYRLASKRAATARRGWQESLQSGPFKRFAPPTAAERAAKARRKAAREAAGPRAALLAAGLQLSLRQRFAGFLAVPREKRWRQAALLLGTVAAVSVAGNVLMYFRFTPARPLVTVGHHVIQDREYRALVDNAAGQPVLTRMVFSELIQQAAAKAGVTPTGAQIDARIADLQRQGQAPAGAVAPEVRSNLALSLALENLRTAGIPASDAEVAAFYKQHAAVFARPAQVNSILVVTQREYLAQTAASLLAKGKTPVQMAAEPDMKVDGQNGFHLDFAALPPALHQAVVSAALAMKPGQIKVMPVGDAFLTVKCLSSHPGSLPPLPEVRDWAARLVKLQKAPTDNAELALLYRSNTPRFDIDRYAAYFSGIANTDVPLPPAVPKTASLPQ